MERYKIGKVRISTTNPEDTLACIEEAVREKQNTYICVANIRSLTHGNTHPGYCEVLNNSFLTVPDGMPLVWVGKAWGLKKVQRTVGPDLFVKMLKDTTSPFTHFLLGDTEETLAGIRTKYADSKIAGTFSPPFCEVEQFDYPYLAEIVNASKADILWVSLRAPKQDYFAIRLLPYLDHKVVIGVGAAFRFSLGQIKHPPKPFRVLGLTVLFWRKKEDPSLLWLVAQLGRIIYYCLYAYWCRLLGKKEV